MPNHRNQRKNTRAYNLVPTKVRLKGQQFLINDISNAGIGIVLEKHKPHFVVGERLEKIVLPMQSGSLTVKGVVTHISLNASHTVCGIRFDLTSDEFKAISHFKKERMKT